MTRLFFHRPYNVYKIISHHERVKTFNFTSLNEWNFFRELTFNSIGFSFSSPRRALFFQSIRLQKRVKLRRRTLLRTHCKHFTRRSFHVKSRDFIYPFEFYVWSLCIFFHINSVNSACLGLTLLVNEKLFFSKKINLYSYPTRSGDTRAHKNSISFS